MGRLGVPGYVAVCVGAALAPLLDRNEVRPAAAFPGWPSHYAGRALTRLPDAPEDIAFYASRAVQHARFSDGQRVLLMRWVDAELAGFHLSDACFRAYGYTLGPIEERVGAAGQPQRCYGAARGHERVQICEHIRDARARTFTSSEAWQLARLLGRAEPPLWAVSSVEPE